MNNIKQYFVAIALTITAMCGYGQPKDFVTVKGHQFFLNNKPAYYIGANYWYGGLLALTQDPERGRQRLIKELNFLKANGVTNLRVLVGAEGTGKINGVTRVAPALQPAQGNFDESVLNSLDFFLAELGKRKMHAVLYLSNNWEWSGGFLQYVHWNKLVDDATVQRKLTWDEQRDYTSKFYGCIPCKEAYYTQVKTILAHKSVITGKLYASDPAIMSWELVNEPRPMRPEAISAYKEWIATTAQLIRSKDKNHLITIGSEGLMGTEDQLSLFKEIHQLKGIDYLTIHIWPKNWSWFKGEDVAGGLDNSIAKTLEYIGNHEKIALELNKPLVIEEFGYPRDHHAFSPAVSTQSRDAYYTAVFAAWKKSMLSNGVIAGCNFWAFGGSSRPVKDQLFWKAGDDFSGDPPQEEQGLNTIFDSDASTWKIIRQFSVSPR